MQTLNGHFDGRVVVPDEPTRLMPNAEVKVIAPDTEDDTLTDSCARLSEPVFKNIWDNPLDADYDRL